ncbi:MAG TPA: hypothetical protein VIN58_06270 [Roseateles sp.]
MGRLPSKVALLMGTLSLAATGQAFAQTFTFHFGGQPPEATRWVAGQITYDFASASSAVDIRGLFDEGHRLLYSGITITFSSAELGTVTWTDGQAMVYDNYDYCYAPGVSSCNAPLQHEADRIHFLRSSIEPAQSFELIVQGDGQNFLSTGDLNTSVLNLPYTSAVIYQGYAVAGNVQLAATPFAAPLPSRSRQAGR